MTDGSHGANRDGSRSGGSNRDGSRSGGLSLLVLPRRGSAPVAGLQITASAVSTLLAFAVAMLSVVFWRVPSDEGGYRLLAVALVVLLLVPLGTLGVAAARLAARSRDERLATLRLLGATARRVRRIAVAESTFLAALGVALGTAASAALPSALALLTVYGRRLEPRELWLPWWICAAIPLLLVAIAAASALAGLRRVVLSPLGVRTRSDAPQLSRLRVVLGAAAVAAAVVLAQSASPGWGATGIVLALSAAVLLVMVVLGVVGPFVLGLLAGLRIRRTSRPAALIAARGILDDPKSAWRQVSAVALTSFIALPSGSVLGYLDAIQNSGSRELMTADQLLLFTDARTMLVALVAVSFLVTACQTGIAQAAAVLERRDLYIALDRIGMPFAELNGSRRRRVLAPAMLAASAGLAWVALVPPLIPTALVVSPLFVAGTVAVIGIGVWLVSAAVDATTPLLRRVLAAPGRGE